MKIITWAMVIFSLFILFNGCSKEESTTAGKGERENKEIKLIDPPYDTALSGKEGIENTIKGYNQAMINALLADPYFKILRKYATEKEVQRVFIDVEFDMNKGEAMRSWQKELVFENISSSENEGHADTSEVWDYEYVSLKTKEVVQPKATVRYKLRYALIKEDGKWVVSNIKEREPAVLTKTYKLKPQVTH